tara:strand:+ start:294 stop:545 length:252 start_codon:yes stop_codon:yes gene_type:complete
METRTRQKSRKSIQVHRLMKGKIWLKHLNYYVKLFLIVLMIAMKSSNTIAEPNTVMTGSGRIVNLKHKEDYLPYTIDKETYND